MIYLLRKELDDKLYQLQKIKEEIEVIDSKILYREAIDKLLSNNLEKFQVKDNLVQDICIIRSGEERTLCFLLNGGKISVNTPPSICEEENYVKEQVAYYIVEELMSKPKDDILPYKIRSKQQGLIDPFFVRHPYIMELSITQNKYYCISKNLDYSITTDFYLKNKEYFEIID